MLFRSLRAIARVLHRLVRGLVLPQATRTTTQRGTSACSSSCSTPSRSSRSSSRGSRPSSATSRGAGPRPLSAPHPSSTPSSPDRASITTHTTLAACRHNTSRAAPSDSILHDPARLFSFVSCCDPTTDTPQTLSQTLQTLASAGPLHGRLLHLKRNDDLLNILRGLQGDYSSAFRACFGIRRKFLPRTSRLGSTPFCGACVCGCERANGAGLKNVQHASERYYIMR